MVSEQNNRLPGKGESLVSNILLQICKNFIGEVAGFFGEGKPLSLEEMEKGLKEKADGFIREMMKAYLELLDKAIVEDKAGRKSKGIVIERKANKREVYTKFGQIKFERTYFYDKKRDDYVHLLDKAVGLEEYERITGTVAIELIEHASESSYGESSRHVSGGEISRQTVMKKIRSLKGLKIEQPAAKRQVKVLHVEADEDHVTLQDGTKAIVPLISIHEGIEKRGQRGRCINIHHISSYGKSSEEIWLEAVNWIYNAYETDTVERIYLHGDGAAWIKEGLNWLPKVKMVLDRYHLNKAIMEATGRQPERRQEIYSVLGAGNIERFKEITRQLYRNAETENERKRIKEFRRYILNNWEGIKIYGEEACGGSCTEGHVSHVLSSRLSSRPMGWSREGLKVMSELRAFSSSGGRVELKHIKDNPLSYKPNKKILTKVAKVFQNVTRERFNNVTLLSKGKVIPLFKCLRGIQNGEYAF